MKSNYNEKTAKQYFNNLVNSYLDYHDYVASAVETGHLDEQHFNTMESVLRHMVNSNTMNDKYAEQYFRSGLNIAANCTWEYDRYLKTIEEVEALEAEERERQFGAVSQPESK